MTTADDEIIILVDVDQQIFSTRTEEGESNSLDGAVFASDDDDDKSTFQADVSETTNRDYDDSTKINPD